TELGQVGRILWIVRQFRFFLGVKVVEIAEKLVKAVDGGQRFVAIANMVLAELARGIAEALEQAPDGRIELAHAHRCAGETDLAQSAPDNVLASEKRGAAGRARLFPIVLKEANSFFADAVDV